MSAFDRLRSIHELALEMMHDQPAEVIAELLRTRYEALPWTPMDVHALGVEK